MILARHDHSVPTRTGTALRDALGRPRTIYLPLGILFVDANAPVADNSAYTALVVRSLQLSEGPKLVLHSDYQSTNIPVPDGLIGSQAVLIK